MNEVSNKTIVALLAVALVVSVAGTLYSVSELNDLGGTYTLLSGAATTTGTGKAEINVTGTVGITVNDGRVEIVDSYYDTSCTTGYGRVDFASETATCWLNSSGGAYHFPTDADNHTLENSGTLPVNISIRWDGADAEAMMCSGGDCAQTATAEVSVKMADDETSCTNIPAVTFNAVATDAGKADVSLCSKWLAQDNNDQMSIWFNLTIPSDTGEVASGTGAITYQVDTL